MDDELPPVTGARLELLKALGYGEMEHDSHVPFLSHLIGTRRLLAAWGSSPALCDAGLFHSVYGTEFFRPDRTPEREAVVDVIGPDAERIAWLWCAIERATLDVEQRRIRLRASGAIEPLTPQEVVDVATLWAADTVEQIARMAPVTGPRLELLKTLGYGELEHDSHVPFLSHLMGTRRLLAAWGSTSALCDAGLFHSVYGTEYFAPDRTPERRTVIDVIGPEAERIAWLWCAIERGTLDPPQMHVRLRGSGAIELLTSQEVADVATLWAADTVEQIARMTPDEQGFADGLLDVLDAVPAPAQEAVRRLG
jgi:hypothetical protein